jgi:flagellin-like hook-associated protein FlgL
MVRAMQTASLTLGMKNALSSLGNLQDQIEKTNNRLATGKKVNTALDNALNFFLADSFNAKARGLQTILDNIGLGLNVIKQADKALTSIRTSLEQAEGTLRAALNTSGTNARAVTTASFRDPITGAASATTLLAEGPATSTTANRFQVGDIVTFNLVSVSSTNSVTTLGAGTALNIGAGTTVQDLLNNINNSIALNPSGQSPRVQAYLNDAGNIIIENQVNGRAASGDTFALQAVINTGATGAQNNSLDIFSFSGAVGANPESTGAGTQTVLMLGGRDLQETRRSAASAFREVLNQVRNSALDAGYNGTNLLQGDFLRTVFNEDETTSIVTQGRRIDAAALGFSLDNVTASTGDAFRNFQGDREMSNALSKIRTAKITIQGISTQFATNGNLMTNRQDYTRSAIKNFTDGADLLTLADINEEGATLSSLQTRQQLAVTALSLANQSDQAILRLF